MWPCCCLPPPPASSQGTQPVVDDDERHVRALPVNQQGRLAPLFHSPGGVEGGVICKSSSHEASHRGAASAHTVPSSHSAPSCLSAVPPSSLPLLSHLLSSLDPSGFFHHPLCAFSHFATVFFICGPAASLLPHPPSCIPSCAPPGSSLFLQTVSHISVSCYCLCV